MLYCIDEISIESKNFKNVVIDSNTESFLKAHLCSTYVRKCTVTAHILPCVIYIGMEPIHPPGGSTETKVYDNNKLKNKHGDCGGDIDNVPLA